MKDYIKNLFMGNKYKTNDKSIIIACYFNPLHSEYRKKAFDLFYDSIKHLNHMIIECVIGDDTQELKDALPIIHIQTESLLWHKESLLNYLIKRLPSHYKYVFWLDADVLFTNKNWLVDSVKVLQTKNILQPFTNCIHLDKDDLKLEYNWKNEDIKKYWTSFCATYVKQPFMSKSEVYNEHGHVGFAWGCRREILDQIQLYDKALIGGADHIMAHAAAGHIPHKCITKSFTDNIDEVNEWSTRFFELVQGKIGSVDGELYHIWHGDIKKRDYLKRVQDFTKKANNITKKDKNGLYVSSDEEDTYMKNYFKSREVITDPLNILGFGIGYILNQDDNYFNPDFVQDQNTVEFGGGEFGGGGAGGSWSDGDNVQVSETNVDSSADTINETETFS